MSPGAGTLLAFPCGLGLQPESKRLVYKDINQYTFFYIEEKNYLNYPIIQLKKKKTYSTNICDFKTSSGTMAQMHELAARRRTDLYGGWNGTHEIVLSGNGLHGMGAWVAVLLHMNFFVSRL